MDDNSEKLRAQAKEELRQGKIIDTSLYETDMKVLVEELSIYQIELEHQNQELMLSQDHLQQSNNRYLDLFDNAPVGYLIVDSTGIIKDINQTACKLLECSKTESINTKISKIIHPDYQDVYYLYFRTLIHQKHNQPCDIKLRKANNSFFYGRIQGVCQTSEIDSDPEFRLAISDISAQKEMEIKLLAAKAQTEKNEKAGQNLLGDLKAEMKLRAKNELALRESEIQYKNLANSGTALIWQSGIDKLCFYFNEPWLNFTGRTLEQEYGNGWADGVHPDDFDHCLSIYVSSFDKRIPFEMEYRMRRADGEYRWILDLGTPNYNSVGEFVGYIGHCFDINDNKQAENRLKESEERFQLLFNKAPLGYQSLDINGCFIEVNQQWLDTLGYERVEVIGKWFGDFLTPMYQDGFRKRFPIFKAQGHIHSEFEMVHKNGSVLFIAFDGRIGNDTDGNFMQTHCILQDITESKRVKEALLESEQRFKVLFEDAPDAIILGDLETELIVDANKEALRLFKCEKHQLIGMQHKDMHPRSNDDNHHESFIDHLANSDIADAKSIFESSILASDGAVIPVDIMSQIVRIAEKDFYLGTLRDITERKEAEIALKESELRFKVLFDDAPDAMLLADPASGRIVDANNAAALLFKKQKQELVGLLQHELHPPKNIDISKSTFKKQFEEKKETSKKIPVENSILCSDGTEIPVEIVGQAIQIGDKSLMLGTFRNITERKQAEEALKQSEEKFAVAFKTSSYVITITRPEDGKFIEVNNAFFSMTGYTAEDMLNNSSIGMDLWIDAEDRNRVVKILRAGGTINEQEFQFKKKNGEIITCLFSAQVINIKNNTYILSSINDITVRKKAEEALKESEKDYRNLIELSPVAMVVIHEWKTLYFNPSAVLLFGATTQDDIINKHIYDFIHPDFRELAIENSKILTENGFVEKQEQKYIKLDGSVLDVETQAKKIRFNDVSATLVVINDITERKQNEYKTQLNAKRLNALVDVLQYSTDSIQDYLDYALTKILEITESKLGYIYHYYEDRKEFVLNTWSKEVMKECRIVEQQTVYQLDKTGLWGEAVRQRKPIMVNDFQAAHPLKKGYPEGHAPLFKYLTLPIFSNNQIVGVVAVANKETDYVDEDITQLSILMDIVWKALERTKSELALIKSEERYEDLLLHLETGIVVHAADTSIVMCNPRASEILGLSIDQMKGKTAIDAAWKFLDIDYTPLLLENYPVNRIKNSKKPIINQILGIQQSLNKDITWVTVNGFLVLNSAGEIIEIVISFNDITNRKLAEDTLKKNQKLLSDTEKIGNVGGWEYYYDSGIMNWTEETYNIHELQYDKNVSLDAGINFYTPEAVPIINNAVQQAIEFSTPFDLVLDIITIKGNIRTVHTIGKCDPENHRIYGFFQDITERKKAEKSLIESEEKLSALFNGMSEMTAIHELTFEDKNQPNNYRIIDCNQAFYKITGIEPENAVGKLATEVYGTEVAPYLEEYSNVCSTKTNYNYQTYYQPMDKHFLISAVPLDGNRFATITADITDIEKAKELVLEKNKELENLIYVASHDLRSPLVNIQGFSQRLENQTSEIVKLTQQAQLETEIQNTIDKISTVEIPKSLGYIKSNITKMDSLINGLLKLSRTGRILMNISEINMSTLFQSIINTHQFELSELDAKVEIDSLINCYGDENQLNQLFSNIIANAIKYRDTNRQLTLRIYSKTQSNKVVYAITDNGIGINNKYLPKIWDIFYRVNPTKSETGEGLGLSVARKITEKHKGKVWVESEVGVGSTFYVELLQNKFEE